MLPWFIRSTVKELVLEWQVEHSLPGRPARVVGIWFDGLPRAVVPLWQVAHRPVTDGVTLLWSKVAPAQVVVEVWQVSHCAVVETWVAGFAWAFTAV